jgi:ribosome-associated protein
MLVISKTVQIPMKELEITAMRAQGAGGQHVNKVSTAIHLRFDIKNSSLPDEYKKNLLALRDQRLTKEGVLVIKAQDSRSQDQNRQDAVQKLLLIIHQANKRQKVRKATKPTKGSIKRRLEGKANRKSVKSNRKKVTF